MNVIDYIKEHQNETFEEFAFNEVDSLIFSLLPYIQMDGILDEHSKKTLKEVAHYVKNKPFKKISYFIDKTYTMLDILSKTKRYQDILLYHYVNIVNQEMQFSALSIKISTGLLYIAFAGTDTSIIGWEEDLKMSYMFPGIGQKYAANYLNRHSHFFDKEIIIGGHSKGGNLAMCAAIYAKFYLKYRIRAIYNFDGPGFLKEQINSREYKAIEKKIKLYVPKDSIVGMLLYHTPNYYVVRAKGFNIFQHNAFTWQILQDHFILDTQTSRSKNLEKKITKKLDEFPLEKRIQVLNHISSTFKKYQITDTRDIKIKDIISLFKDFKSLDEETKNWITELILILFIK